MEIDETLENDQQICFNTYFCFFSGTSKSFHDSYLFWVEQAVGGHQSTVLK